jgi:pimeloyl-ACP methyl ester carboxylesterase
MARFVLVHGAGSDGWHWHLVAPVLEAAGHEVVAVDMPAFDDTAGFDDYVSVIVKACEGADDGLAIIAHSLGAFPASAACAHVDADLLGLTCPMVPAPHETAGDWWADTGFESPERDDVEWMFLHDVPPDLIAASEAHAGNQSGRVFADPWPLDAWPDVRTRVAIGLQDRFFPPDFQRRVMGERLPGVVLDEIDTGHCPYFARPEELADLLLAWWAA